MSDDAMGETLTHLTSLRDRALANHAEFKASGAHVTAAYFEGKAIAFTTAIESIKLVLEQEARI